MKAQPSLDYVLKSIYKTTYLDKLPDEGITIPDNSPDLTRWANQGVLLINTALSTEVGKSGSHQKQWLPFISYLLDILNSDTSGLIFVFLGKKAQELEDLIGSNHHKLFASHPASAAYNNQAEWNCNNIWNEINTILDGSNRDRIIW